MFGNKSKKTKDDKKANKKDNKKNVSADTIPTQMDTFNGPTYKVAVTKSIRHESGLVLDKGDAIIRDFKISSPDGDGWLVITIDRLYVVIRNKGVHLFLEWMMINDYNIKGNNLTITWHEEYIHKYNYTIKILNNKIADAEKTMLIHQYPNDARYVTIPAEEHEMLRRGRITKQIHVIKELENEMDELRKKLDVLVNEFESKQMTDAVDIPGSKHIIKPEDGITIKIEDIIDACPHVGDGSWSQTSKSAYVTEGRHILKRITEIENMMDGERDNLYFIAFDTVQRSTLIPSKIDNKDVWYDMYYDAKRDAYVKVGNTFPTTPEMIKLRKDMKMPYGCGFSPERASETKIVLGQPAIHHRYMSLSSMSTVWSCVPGIGIENYHYMRFMNETPLSLHGKCSYLMTPNSYHNGLYNKEYVRLAMRTGNSPCWERDYDSKMHSEILEEELYLAKEGNINYMSLALEDTTYADGEDISRIPKLDNPNNEIGFEAFTFNK